MKKLVVTLLVGMLSVFGLTFVSAGSAVACSAYSGCVPTSSTVKAKHVKAGAKATLKAKVVSTSGNVKPKGVVKFVVTAPNGRQYFYSARLRNGKVSIKSLKLSPGTYKVQITFAPKKGSVFNSSGAKITITVS